MIKEVWKDIKGYENLYQASNLGRIRSLDKYVNGRNSKRLVKGRELSLFNDRYGYKIVNLYKNKKIKLFKVHRLVAETFIPNPNNLPQVNHKDENKENNNVDNLEWITLIDNCNYGTRNQRISKKINQYDLNGNYIRTWDSIILIERELNIFHSRIIEVCKGQRKQIGGYKWKYANGGITK